MKKQPLILVLFAMGFLLAAVPSAQAGNPIWQPGRPAFTPAFLTRDGPQPFSTRRTRELQAARSQGNSQRGLLFSGASGNRRPLGIFQSSRRPIGLFGRSGRFR